MTTTKNLPTPSSDVALAETPFDRALPLWDHLEELRGRIIASLIAWLLLSVPGYLASPRLIHHLSASVGPMVFVRPTEAFLVRLKIGLILGGILSAPAWIWHAWRFVGTGLTRGERRVVTAAVPFSILLFAAGVCLAWFAIAPIGLKFLVTFGSEDLRPMISVDAALGFSLWLCLGLGALFQMPIVLAVLAKAGLVSAQDLRRYRRHAVLAILIVSAVVTPGPDVTSQMLMAAPTYILFELSIILCAFLAPQNP